MKSSYISLIVAGPCWLFLGSLQGEHHTAEVEQPAWVVEGLLEAMNGDSGI